MFSNFSLLRKALSILVGVQLLGIGLIAHADVAPRPPPSDPFTDVHAGNEYFESVLYLKNANIVIGYPDGSFGPANPINRAEFAKIVLASRPGRIDDGGLYPRSRVCFGGDVMRPGEPPVSVPSYFSDVKDEWFSSYVCAAKMEGIIGGYPDGTFRPNNTIKFAEAAKIVVLAYGLEYDQSVKGEWYQPYWDTLRYRENGTNLIPRSIHSPAQLITRGEMAELIHNISRYKSIYSRTYPIK